MLNPERNVTDCIDKLEPLLKRFKEGTYGYFLSTDDEALYRQLVMEAIDLLQTLFGVGNFYSKNLISAANEGTDWQNSPSYAGVQNVIAVLRAAATKLRQQYPDAVETKALEVLSVLAASPRAPGKRFEPTGPELAEMTGLDENALNGVIALLAAAGLAGVRKAIKTAPYDFLTATITSRGRYELQRLAPSGDPGPAPPTKAIHSALMPPSPVGSPYGFREEDWELVAVRRADTTSVRVVLGHQFESSYFETAKLHANVQAMFAAAIEAYASLPDAMPISLAFAALSAGYGEHLFNQIARDIIAADIAVFETSDLNPNVMLELGVALTWGIRVLPIKLAGRPKPPSDVSGQTWADYEDSGGRFVDVDHHRKLVSMVQRSIQKKRALGGP